MPERLIVSAKRPCREALRVADDTWLVTGEAADREASHPGAVNGIAAAARIRRRTDLDPHHPLYNKRVLPRSESPGVDRVVEDDGSIVVYVDGKPLEEGGAPGLEVAGEVRRVP